MLVDVLSEGNVEEMFGETFEWEDSKVVEEKGEVEVLRRNRETREEDIVNSGDTRWKEELSFLFIVNRNDFEKDNIKVEIGERIVNKTVVR